MNDHEDQIVRYVQQTRIIVVTIPCKLVNEKYVMERDNHSVHQVNRATIAASVRAILFLDSAVEQMDRPIMMTKNHHWVMKLIREHLDYVQQAWCWRFNIIDDLEHGRDHVDENTEDKTVQPVLL